MMKKSALSFTCNRQQRNALEGLAYHIADSAYIKDRYGENEPELKGVHETISSLFAELDQLHVPFWVQNSVIAFAENWRRYKDTYMDVYLKRERNIIL